MKNINVYGSGCKNCITVANMVKDLAEKLAIEVNIEKITDLQAIMEAGVVRTPAISIDGKLVHSGSVPSTKWLEQLLS